MKKINMYLKLLLVVILGVSSVMNVPIAYGEDGTTEEVKVINGESEVLIELINPELNSLDQANRPADTYTLFTRDFVKETTATNEWGVEVVVSDGEVIYVSQSYSGNHSIPKDGYVISVIDGSGQEHRDNLRNAFAVGDQVELHNFILPELDDSEDEEVDEPTGIGKVINPNGFVVNVDAINTTRSKPMVVLYTSQFGEKTGTNQWGREMVVDINENEQLEVIGFRDIGEGGASGINIPRWGFVLSAFGEEQRELLKEDNLFSVGDIVSLKDINLIQLDNEESLEYVTVNPTPETNPAGVEDAETDKYFPGLRGADQLLIYTSDWKTETTGTNEYGYEVIVEGDFDNGTIVNAGGNNSYIPENGYVLSGHGVGASFLIANASMGSKVSIDETTNTVTIKTTPSSLMASALTTLNLAREQLETAELGLYNIDMEGAKSALNQANKYEAKAQELLVKFNQGEATHADRKEFLSTLDALESNALLTYYRTFESREVEGRAIWHRPTEKSLEDVKNNLDEFKDANFNLIFIETWNDGYSITQSDHELISLQPRIAGGSYGEYKDLLEAYVEEGKKRGMEVHAWVQNYRVGHKGNTPSSPIIEQRPEWALIHYNGDVYTPHENNYVFMDPAVPDVQDFLITYYKDLVENYDIKGLQLDYIRYPVGHYKSDSGYGDYSMSAFKEAEGIDQDADLRELLDRNENPQLYEAWNEWKVNNVTQFVKRSYQDLKAIDEELVLSTAIFENINDSIGTKNQDWPTWVQSGWVDLTNPMAYYRDANTVSDSVASMVDLVDGMALNYAGIAPTYMGLSESENATQTEAARTGLAQGSAIFASQNVLGLPSVQKVLLESTYRKEAVLPHGELSEVMEVGIKEILSNIENIYLPHGRISEETYHELSDKILQVVSAPIEHSVDLKDLHQELNEWKTQASNYFNAPADQRFTESLDYLMDILSVRMRRMELTEQPMIHQVEDVLSVNQSYINQVVELNEMVIDLNDYEGATTLQLTVTQAKQLKESSIRIQVKNKEATLVLPPEYLTGNLKLSLYETDTIHSDYDQKALSKVMTISLTVDNEEITNLGTPITLSYNLKGLSPNTSIYYFNQEIGEWEREESNVLDDAIKTVLTHLSTFAVFSNETFIGSPGEGDVDQSEDEAPNDSSDGETTQGDDEVLGSGEIDSDDEGSNSEGYETDSLPNTATSLFNYLLIGLLMMLVSGFGLLLMKKRSKLIK